VRASEDWTIIKQADMAAPETGTAKGMRHLGALTEARHNHHWDELWLAS
jgi:hypothetical protein